MEYLQVIQYNLHNLDILLKHILLHNLVILLKHILLLVIHHHLNLDINLDILHQEVHHLVLLHSLDILHQHILHNRLILQYECLIYVICRVVQVIVKNAKEQWICLLVLEKVYVLVVVYELICSMMSRKWKFQKCMVNMVNIHLLHPLPHRHPMISKRWKSILEGCFRFEYIVLFIQINNEN